jgi:hypothetical protein
MVMRLVVLTLVIAFSVILTPLVYAQSLTVTGQAGYLGEWELTANVAQAPETEKKAYVGPLVLRHAGLCTQDGPEEKTGEIRLQLSGSGSRVTATLSFDGTACSFKGVKEDAYNGTMSCPDRRDVPLLLWLK